jgi:PAS domain S-box-containing protein
MNHGQEPTYQDMKRRLDLAESALQALRSGEVDTIVGDRQNLVVRLAEAEAREAHLKQVLLAIRNVNQLIVAENDPIRLVERACDTLTQTLGYFNAWAVLVDNHTGGVVTTAAAGFDNEFAPLDSQLRHGQFPHCVQKALELDRVVVVQDPPSECPECPVAKRYIGRAGLIHRLAFDETVYGVLSVSVPAAFAFDTEEQDLFRELAGDLAFALHKHDSERLRRAAERERIDILESISDAFFALDENLVVTYYNGAAARQLGRPADEVVGRPLFEAFPEARGSIFEENYREALRTGRPLSFETYFDIPPFENWYEVRVYPREKGISVYFLVTTERKEAERERLRLEEQYRQAQKMEAVGRLAGGVAHDFNNMLSVILGHAEMVLNKMDDTQPLHRNLCEIQKAAQRSADLTRQLLAFARKQTIVPKVLDLNETVSGMHKMLRRLIGEDIELVFKPSEDLWPVKMDPSQIDQLLANLCVNARDAITGVGKIVIETQNAHIDPAYCETRPDFQPGDYVQLTVSDNGVGMPPEVLEQAFEPFYTTKGAGKGTGLGLATVYGIVRQNGGFVNIYSEPELGASFRLYLPRFTGAAAAATPSVHAEADHSGHETVLVVEDEPSILDLTRTMLETLGYDVLSANTPGAAFDLADTHLDAIDLVITDVVMPEMNGRQLAEQLLHRKPDLKVLYMSGYTDDVIADHGILEAGAPFLQKPFTPQTLGRRIREVLEG